MLPGFCSCFVQTYTVFLYIYIYYFRVFKWVSLCLCLSIKKPSEVKTLADQTEGQLHAGNLWIDALRRLESLSSTIFFHHWSFFSSCSFSSSRFFLFFFFTSEQQHSNLPLQSSFTATTKKKKKNTQHQPITCSEKKTLDSKLQINVKVFWIMDYIIVRTLRTHLKNDKAQRME